MIGVHDPRKDRTGRWGRQPYGVKVFVLMSLGWIAIGLWGWFATGNGLGLGLAIAGAAIILFAFGFSVAYDRTIGKQTTRIEKPEDE